MTDPRTMPPPPPQPSPSEDDVAVFLQAQTTWRGETPELFRKAMESAPVPQQTTARRDLLAMLRRPAFSALAAVIVVGVCMTMILPLFGKARSSARSMPVMSSPDAVSAAASSLDREVMQNLSEVDRAEWSRRALGGGGSTNAHASFLGGFRGDLKEAAAESSDHRGKLTSDVPPDRLVIRKATIQLLTTDVRAAFSKAQLLLRADLNEYAEASTLTGENETAQAQLTLRVAASRLDAVLNELRPLGKVQSENSTGDDVTTQAVDLDARLRNERRVETEVQQLLESRKDAPLKEILDLRDKLAEIRQSIETMQARRDTLGRQVALATILVIIRADAKAKPAAETEKHSFFDQLSTRLGAAADNGAHSLTSSLAFLLETLIAGAFWWVVLFIAFLAIRRHLALRPKVSI